MKKLLLLFSFVFASYPLFSQDYSEQKALLVSAEVFSNPVRITLSWPDPATPATNYKIYKRAFGATGGWGAPYATLPDTSNSFTDMNVAAGDIFEYYVQKSGTPPAFSYISAGIYYEAGTPPRTLLLLIDSTYYNQLTAEITGLQNDLFLEGWKVTTVYISRNTTPPLVKSIIQAEKTSDPALSTVFLLGRIPVPYSGNLNPDGHPDHQGAWPCDGYYGDLNGTWTDASVNNTSASRVENHNIAGDGKFDHNSYPSALELSIGRVDMYNMPSFGTDLSLVAQYLHKNHAYRTGQLVANARGLVEDNFLGFNEGFSASARAGFTALFGQGGMQLGNYTSTSSLNGSALWSYGCGGGSYTSAGGIYNSSDFVGDSLKSIFTMLFGSYFGDWDNQDNFLRAPLAHKGWTLTNFWSGRPYFFAHAMAAGQPIGYAAVRTMNAGSSYASSYGSGGVHQGLMGDPSLTLYPIDAGNTAFSINGLCGSANITFASTDTNLAGYHVYASNSLDSHFVMISQGLVTQAGFTETNLPHGGRRYYLVRPVQEIINGSGTFYLEGRGMLDSTDILEPVVIQSLSLGQDSTGTCDGSAALTITGPGNYTYLWNPNVSNNATATDLCTGNYTVIVMASNGCSASTAFSIYNSLGVGLNEDLYWNIYPNPAHDQFTISTNIAYPKEVNIMDASGKIFRTVLIAGPSVIPVSDWPAGVYFMTDSRQELLPKKIIITH